VYSWPSGAPGGGQRRILHHRRRGGIGFSAEAQTHGPLAANTRAGPHRHRFPAKVSRASPGGVDAPSHQTSEATVWPRRNRRRARTWLQRVRPRTRR